MSTAPYFPFYPQDWLSDPKVALLSLEAQGAYFTLLCQMWVLNEDCTLRDDDASLARLLRLTPARWRKIRSALIDCYTPLLFVEDGRLISKRLRQEFHKFTEKCAKNKAAAEKRWRGHDAKALETKAPSDASALPDAPSRTALPGAIQTSEPDSDLNSKPRRKKTSKPASSKDLREDERGHTDHIQFANFKEIYPDRPGAQGWGIASRHFSSLVEDGLSPEALIVAAKAYRAKLKGLKDRSTVQQAATFLGPEKETWKEFLPKDPVKKGGEGSSLSGSNELVSPPEKPGLMVKSASAPGLAWERYLERHPGYTAPGGEQAWLLIFNLRNQTQVRLPSLHPPNPEPHSALPKTAIEVETET